MSGLHKSVRAGSSSDGVVRVHLIAGGFPVGSAAGHDHDWIRTQLTSMLTTDAVGVQLSHAMDFSDVEKYLPGSSFLVTYMAGPFPDDDQNAAIQSFLEQGGRWLAFHGSSGGKAGRVLDDQGNTCLLYTSPSPRDRG